VTRERELLTDLSPRFSKWQERRMLADTVAEVFRNGAPSHRFRADHIAQCSTILQMRQVLAAGGTIKWQAHTRRCRDRFCPMCQILHMLSWKARAHAALWELVCDHPDVVGIALTFTVINCDIEDLRATLSYMTKAWGAMIRRPPWPPNYGWLRVTEITAGEDGTAHPHFHVLLLVPHSYFHDSYLNQYEWMSLWQRFLKVSYRPRVDVRRVKPQETNVVVGTLKHGALTNSEPDLNAPQHAGNISHDRQHEPLEGNAAWEALCRTLDYDLKPADLASLITDPDWFRSFAYQVRRTRLIEVGGLLRKIMHQVKIEQHLERQRTRATIPQTPGTHWIWNKEKRRYVRQTHPVVSPDIREQKEKRGHPSQHADASGHGRERARGQQGHRTLDLSRVGNEASLRALQGRVPVSDDGVASPRRVERRALPPGRRETAP
jgi:plasmid rolling circle replication initiator protein Rep